MKRYCTRELTLVMKLALVVASSLVAADENCGYR